MTTEKSVNLISYTHDREAHYKATADEIYNLINDFSEQQKLSNLYNYFNKKYELPESVIKKKICQHIANSYLFQDGKFTSNLFVSKIPSSLLEYGGLFYALFFIRRKCRLRKFELIIDDINAPHELSRFEKLLNLFGKDKVLCITRDVDLKNSFPDYHILTKKAFRDIGARDLLKSIIHEFFLGIWVVLKVSIQTRVNLLPVSIRIIHDYLSFKSIFHSNSSKYMIQERHYGTNPIKNYLFKKYGGLTTTTIQKNIFQYDPMFYYMDTDILFSLGNFGYDEFIKYGGRIDRVQPVGSLFMEYYWFGEQHHCKEKYDLMILGINTSNAYQRLDSYNKFMEDYYSLYNWAAQLSLLYPEIKIALIHHGSAGKDEIEDKILSKSNVQVLDKNINSYEAAFSSKCAITYGSTMGYELNAHRLPTFFIDPEHRCSFLPEKGVEHVDLMRITSYDSFQTLCENILNNNCCDKESLQKYLDMWCLKSSSVSNRIYEKFINEEEKIQR